MRHSFAQRLSNRLHYVADRFQVAIGRRSEHEVAFRRIYRSRAWGSGGIDGAFYSGLGSDSEVVEPYVSFVSDYIRRHRVRSVVDLGCGDFRASRQLELGDASYVGIDIVPELIAHNQRHYASAQIQFRHLDILRDPLPEADLYLVKQVLQHLPNEDIAIVLQRLERFAHVLILDGRRLQPEHDGSPNALIAAGSFRTDGTDLDQPPFNTAIEELLVYESEYANERFRLVRLLDSGEHT